MSNSIVTSADRNVEKNKALVMRRDTVAIILNLLQNDYGIDLTTNQEAWKKLADYVADISLKERSPKTMRGMSGFLKRSIIALLNSKSPLLQNLESNFSNLYSSPAEAQLTKETSSILNANYYQASNSVRSRKRLKPVSCYTALPKSLAIDENYSQIYSRVDLMKQIDYVSTIYHEIIHLSVCCNGCDEDKHCRWFKRILDHTKSCNENTCQNKDCLILRVTIAHMRYCEDTDCAVCRTVKKYHEDIEESKKPKGLMATFYNVMSFSNIETYMSLLQDGTSVWWKPSTLKSETGKVINTLMDGDKQRIFSKPVSIDIPGCSKYYQIIKQPIDLSTIQRKNMRGEYHSIHALKRDVCLLLSNARVFNSEESDVVKYAAEMEVLFNALFKELVKKDGQNKESYYAKKENHQICSLCGGGQLMLEGQSLHCNGECGDIIELDKKYYADSSYQHVWCESCYNKLGATITIDDIMIKKIDLILKENTHSAKEGWVQCYMCKKRYHTVCALYNTKMNNQQKSSSYHCPQCILHMKENDPSIRRITCFPRADDLAETELSSYLEARVNTVVTKIQIEESKRMNIPVEDVPSPYGLTIRLVVNSKENVEIKPAFLNYYKNFNFPKSIPYKQKCICLFQRINGLDVLLFIMYVYECSEYSISNNKSVYISYLDSVRYLTPARYRTPVYQEIVLGYIAYSKQRGFNTAHIWVCPPKKGDDYIIFSHPPEQKTPSTDKLQKWYMELLMNGYQTGIITEVTNLVDEYLSGKYNRGLDDSSLLYVPHYPGDHWAFETNIKCQELLQSGCNPIPNHYHGVGRGPVDEDDELSDSSVSVVTQNVHIPASKSRRMKKKGALLTKLYECMKDYKVRLLVVKLQYQCKYCGVFMKNDICYHICESNIEQALKRTSKKQIDMEIYCCRSCFQTQLTPADRERCKQIELSFLPREDNNIEIISRVFESRQIFLGVCQSNHYQFDQMRRAVYSTIMIIYHCFNPNVPICIHTCNSCGKSIVSGTRWHCIICNDFDMCDECKRIRSHEHELTPFDVALTRVSEELDVTNTHHTIMSQQLLALNHCFTCDSPTCSVSFCPIIKALLHHFVICHQQNCDICKEMQSIISTHVKQCNQMNCRVPHSLNLYKLSL